MSLENNFKGPRQDIEEEQLLLPCRRRIAGEEVAKVARVGVPFLFQHEQEGPNVEMTPAAAIEPPKKRLGPIIQCYRQS